MESINSAPKRIFTSNGEEINTTIVTIKPMRATMPRDFLNIAQPSAYERFQALDMIGNSPILMGALTIIITAIIIREAPE